MRKGLWVSVLLLAVVLILPTACKAPVEPAEFEVVSLDVAPPEVTAGETASITAQVKNVGGSEGVYTAILTVDGVEVETKEVTIAPGASKTVTFSLVKDIPGTYQVGIGGLTSGLTVQASKLIADFVWDGKYAGDVVKFSDNYRNAVSWLWDFGDDSPKSNEQHPRHSYQLPGVYSVTLRVENPAGADEKTQKVFIFKKGEIYLLKLAVSPDPEALQAGVPYKATTTFLADLAAGEPEILNLCFFWDWEGPFRLNGSIFGKVKLVEYGTLWKSLSTNNPGRYKLRCYVEYKLPDGTIKQSNEVNTYINVK